VCPRSSDPFYLVTCCIGHTVYGVSWCTSKNSMWKMKKPGPIPSLQDMKQALVAWNIVLSCFFVEALKNIESKCVERKGISEPPFFLNP